MKRNYYNRSYGNQEKKTNSSKIRKQFMNVISTLELEYSMDNIIYPEEIYWVAGPTKSGKTTSACVLLEEIVYERNALLSMRNLVIGVAQKYKGRTNMDEIVENLMRTILRKGREGCKKIIVDDFQSTSCARGLPFLYEHLCEIARKYNRPQPKFKFCILYSDEKNSFKRYKASCPKKLWNSNEFNEKRFQELYNKYSIRTNQVSEALRLYFQFDIIDTNGTQEMTYNNVLKEVRKKKNGQKFPNASLKKLLSTNPTVLRPKKRSPGHKRHINEKQQFVSNNDKKEFTKFVRAMYQRDLIESQKVINSFIVRDNERKKSPEKNQNNTRFSSMLSTLKTENKRLMNKVKSQRVINSFIERDDSEQKQIKEEKENTTVDEYVPKKKRNRRAKYKNKKGMEKNQKSNFKKQSKRNYDDKKKKKSSKTKQQKAVDENILKLKKQFEKLVRERKNLNRKDL